MQLKKLSSHVTCIASLGFRDRHVGSLGSRDKHVASAAQSNLRLDVKTEAAAIGSRHMFTCLKAGKAILNDKGDEHAATVQGKQCEREGQGYVYMYKSKEGGAAAIL